MKKDSKIISENLDKEQNRTLTSLLNLIIPASEDGKMPGVFDIGFIDYINNENQLSLIQEGLIRIIDETNNQYCQEFSALSVAEQLTIVNVLKRKLFRFFTDLTTQVVQYYYQHDDILNAIGLDARPPFPKGYDVEEGDILLLEPVFLRGKIYLD